MDNDDMINQNSDDVRTHDPEGTKLSYPTILFHDLTPRT